MRWASASPRWSIRRAASTNPVLGQFLSILATFLFLAMDGHLVLVAIDRRKLSRAAAGQCLARRRGDPRPRPVRRRALLRRPVHRAAGRLRDHPRPDRDGHARPLGAAAQPVRGRLPGRPARRHRPARHRRAGDRRRHQRARSAPASTKRGGSRGRLTMSDDQNPDQKTEAPTPKRRREAAEKGDVLQSRELGTALVMLVGAAWIALAGPMLIELARRHARASGLSFDAADVQRFRSRRRIAAPARRWSSCRCSACSRSPSVAAVAAPALLGSLGFRASAFALQGQQAQPARRHQAHVRHAGADRAGQVDRQGGRCSARSASG